MFLFQMRKPKLLGVFILIFLCSFSCKKKKTENNTKTEFQKSDLLSNIGTNLIVPEYQQLLVNLSDLESNYVLFIANKTDLNLENVRTSWKSAYKKWYSVSVYEFGPAMNEGLRNAVGVFPTDTLKIISNTNASSYVLGSATNVDAIGFSSFDFLMYRKHALNYFSNSSTYSQYGLDVIRKIKSEVTNVVNSWNTTYLTTFKSSTGTESTSAFSLLINEFNKTYELAKNAKLGIPIGKQSLGIKRPEYIEARLSAISLDLLYENVSSLQRVFNGNTVSGTLGIGFDDYLVALDRGTLSTSINTQFSAILNDINQLTLSLEEEMNTNPHLLDNLYTKMQNLVVSIKTDMPSSFGVLITYQDNDGD